MGAPLNHDGGRPSETQQSASLVFAHDFDDKDSEAVRVSAKQAIEDPLTIGLITEDVIPDQYYAEEKALPT